MTAKKPRVVWVVECRGCGEFESAHERKTWAHGDVRHWGGYPCTRCARNCGYRVVKYVPAPKARRAKG